MNRADDVGSRIQAWVYQEFPLARRNQIGPQDSLLDSGIVDSLGTLEVVAFVEQEFGVQITDDEMVADHFETLSSITALVEAKLAAAQTARSTEHVESQIDSHRSV